MTARQPSPAVRDHLRRIYGAEVEPMVSAGIDALISQYQERLDNTPRPAGLSERDVMLITYGDTLNTDGEPPLDVLRRFLDDHLEDTFPLVHILPFHPFTSDDGFSVVDYFQVRDDLGDWADINHIAATSRLMADAVINHMSSESAWFKGYLADEPEYADFFLDVDPATDLSDVVRPRTSPLLSSYEDSLGMTRHIWTTFSRDQVDLNYGNPKVLLAVIEVLFYLISQGARLLRLDAVTFLWKEPGTTSANLKETHALIKIMRDAVSRLSSDVIIVTETNVPHHENVAYFGDGADEAHMVYNFALPPLIAHSFVNGSAERLSTWASSLTLPSEEVCFLNFSASHDGVGVRPVEAILDSDELDALVAAATESGGKVSCRSIGGEDRPYELNCTFLDLISRPDDIDDIVARRFVASQAIVLAMPGVPAIYIQSLLGTRNDHQSVAATGRARSINRSRHDLDGIVAELGSGDSLRAEVFAALTELIRVRQQKAAFGPYAGFEILTPDARVFAIKRVAASGEDSLIAVVNLTDQALNVEFADDASGLDILSGDTVDLHKVAMDGFGVRWIELEKAA